MKLSLHSTIITEKQLTFHWLVKMRELLPKQKFDKVCEVLFSLVDSVSWKAGTMSCGSGLCHRAGHRWHGA